MPNEHAGERLGGRWGGISDLRLDAEKGPFPPDRRYMS